MRRIIPLLLIVTALACGDDGPSRPVLPAPPVFSALTVDPDSVLADTVFIAVEAERADRAVLLVDDVEAAADTLAPFLLVWDSRTAANGRHELAVLAVNEAGYADSCLTRLVDNLGAGVVVLVDPEAVTLASEESVQFAATVLGAEDRRVTWGVLAAEIPGPLDAGSLPGTVDSTGLYTAPAVVPVGWQIGVRATSVADPAASGSAPITLTQGPAVVMTSAPAEVVLGESVRFEAAVYGAADTTVTWSVDEGAAHGSVDETGLYTAPPTLPDPPQVTVRATSRAHPDKSAAATASLIRPVLVTVTPGAATVSENGLLVFTATVENAADPKVEWSLVEGRRFGTILADGLYMGPSVLPDPPRVTVRARSKADPRFEGTATVDLVEGPPPGEDVLLGSMYEAGFHAANLAEQITGIVGGALTEARTLSGNPELIRGTLYETEEGWRYAGDQPEEFRVVPIAGPAWLMHFDVADFWMDSPSSDPCHPGMFLYGELDCTVSVEGHQIRLTNSSRTLGDAAKPGDIAWSTEFERTLQGAIPAAVGGLWTVDYAHEGTSEWGPLSNYQHRVEGTLTNPDGVSYALEESLYVGYAYNCCGCPWFDGKSLEGDFTGVFGGDTYVWSDVSTGIYYDSCEPTALADWRASGHLTKNGTAYGEITLSLPLPAGLDDDPHPTLEFAYGHRVMLWVPPMDDAPWMVPSPFPR